MDPTKAQQPYYQRQHDEAVCEGQQWYVDEKTGFLVFTEQYHRDRGHCCQSNCRHCPYGYSQPSHS